MGSDKFQHQRFELKYIITEAAALAVRDFVRSYLDIDEFGASQPNLSYPVHSLYLDSDQLYTYNTTINGDKNRFKLRLRFYDDNPETPIFFEIKRRTNNTISKLRGGVKKEAVPWLLAGHLPDPSHLISNQPKQLVALQRFSELMQELRARPKAHIYYLREAWISRADNSVRITLDRDVRLGPRTTPSFSTDLTGAVSVFGNNVVLELKFTNRFPDWFRDLVRVFNLMQCGAAKYVDGINALGDCQQLRGPSRSEYDTEFFRSTMSEKRQSASSAARVIENAQSA